MSYAPEEWAKEWLLQRREEGETGLTVEKRGNSHYVRWATTVWDPVEKKRRKISEYRGKLTEDGVLHPPEPKRGGAVVDVRDEGLSKVLAKAAEGFIAPLKAYFPDFYPELLALSFCKCAGKTELKKANVAWNDMLDVLGLKPRTHPGSLADALRAVGRAKGARGAFFDDLQEEMEGTFGLSVRLFGRGKAFVVKGHQDASGMDLAYVCLMEPGCAKLSDILADSDLPIGTVAILGDNHSRKALEGLAATGLDFSVAVVDGAGAFGDLHPDGGSFIWDGGAVLYGKGVLEGFHTYVFEDLTRKNAEIVEGFRKGQDPGLNPGRTIVVSTLDTDPEAVYSWHMGRDAAERYFLSAGEVLDSDTFPWDGDGLEGNDFVALLSMMMMLKIEGWISEAGMEGEMSADDVLEIYSSVKSVHTTNGPLDFKVGEEVIDLDGKLGLGIYFGKKKKKRVKRRR